MAAAKQHLLG